jgi:hypothetical protein
MGGDRFFISPQPLRGPVGNVIGVRLVTHDSGARVGSADFVLGSEQW